MPKSAMIRARTEPGLKNEVERIFSSLGLNATQALNLFYRQVQLNKGIPFDIKLTDNNRTSKVSLESQRALIKKAKAKSPDDRLAAFFEHSYLLANMKNKVKGLKRRKSQ